MGLFIVISFVLIMVGLIMIIVNVKKSYFSNYIETEGTIVDIQRKEEYDREEGYSITYAPVIEYEVNGVMYDFVSKVSSSMKPKLGKKVIMMYNPDNPNKCVKKNDLTGLWFVIFGMIFIIASFFIA